MKLIHLTDTHFVGPGEELYGLDPRKRLDLCVADINRHHADADLAVITGDLTHFGDRPAFQNLKESLDNLVPPLRLIVGNHDLPDPLTEIFPDVELDENGFVQSVLDRPEGRFLFLDSTLEGTHAGHYCEKRLAWLEQQLKEAEGRPCFLFMHHPPFPIHIKPMDRIALKEAGAFGETVAPYIGQIRHLFFGHVHRPISGSWRGIPFTTLRGTNHQVGLDFETDGETPGSHEPPAYAIVFIDPDQVVVHFHDFLDTSARFDLSETEFDFWEEQRDRVAADVA